MQLSPKADCTVGNAAAKSLKILVSWMALESLRVEKDEH